MAPSTRLPSSPRLMRPDFSVRHSPSATNMKGVETRMAPPIIAMNTMKMSDWLMSSSSVAFRLQEGNASVEGLADEQHHEDHALQHQHRGVRHRHAALDQATGGVERTEQNRHGDNGERI